MTILCSDNLRAISQKNMDALRARFGDVIAPVYAGALGIPVYPENALASAIGRAVLQGHRWEDIAAAFNVHVNTVRAVARSVQ